MREMMLPTFYLTRSDRDRLSEGFYIPYNNAREFFDAVAPDLTKNLDKETNFWTKVADNTISDEYLRRKLAMLYVSKRYDMDGCRASYLLLMAREAGVLERAASGKAREIDSKKLPR